MKRFSAEESDVALLSCWKAQSCVRESQHRIHISEDSTRLCLMEIFARYLFVEWQQDYRAAKVLLMLMLSLQLTSLQIKDHSTVAIFPHLHVSKIS